MQKEKWRNTNGLIENGLVANGLVEKGYSQVEGIDFGDIFSLISKLNYIRFMLYVVVEFGFEVEQMDVKKTFLHGNMKEEIY